MQQTQIVKERLEKAIINMPQDKLEQLTDYAEYLLSKDEWEATREIMCDPEMKQQVDLGIEEAKAGKVKSWRDIK